MHAANFSIYNSMPPLNYPTLCSYVSMYTDLEIGFQRFTYDFREPSSEDEVITVTLVKLDGRKTEQTLTVNLSSQSQTPNVLIQSASNGDGGVEEQDYSIVHSVLLWKPEDRSLTIPIRITADARLEGSEGFQLTAHVTVDGSREISTASTYIVIEDSDGEYKQFL